MNKIKSIGKFKILLVIMLILSLFIGCGKEKPTTTTTGAKLETKDVISMEIKFDDTLKETYTKEKNGKEIEGFINAYNNSKAFSGDEGKNNRINVVLKLEGGKEIYFNGGMEKYVKVKNDGKETKIEGKDLLKIFEDFAGQFNND